MDIIQSRKVPEVVTERDESLIDPGSSLSSLGHPEKIYDRPRRQIILWKGDVVYVFKCDE